MASHTSRAGLPGICVAALFVAALFVAALFVAAACGDSQPTPCADGTFGADCAETCACTNGSSCNDGLEGDGVCTCAAGTFGAECAGACACEVGGVCDDGAAGTGVCSDSYALSLEFVRLDSATPSPFRVDVTLHNNGTPVPDATLATEVSAGTAGAVANSGGGNYAFTVTPAQTGEHKVTVTYQGTTVTQTAVVMASVGADWGQPMAVPGLVNTAGYEDGATITSDGEYLFVQYGPVYFSGVFLFGAPRASGGCEGNRLEFPVGVANRCTHPWLDMVQGPITAPERPGFFTGRISADGTTYRHNAASWGLGDEQAPVLALSTMFYGFRRQADGSFAEPFHLAFDDAKDGIIGPYGLSFVMHGDGTSTVAFAVDDPADADMVDFDGNGSDDAQSLTDIFTMEITMGTNTVLGNYAPSGVAGTPPVRSTPFPSTLVNFGKTGINGIAGTQGNPHLHAISGTVESVWTDDERDGDADSGEITVFVRDTGAYPNGTWTKTILPSVVNVAEPSDEIQPFFTGTGLYFARLGSGMIPAIKYAAYSGDDSTAGYSNASNWSAPQELLTASSSITLGAIIGVGEPTVATRDDGEYLYFIYGYVRGMDTTSGLPDVNMQVGFVKKR